MRGFSSSDRLRRLVAPRLLLACCLVALAASRLPAQSTFGAIFGTVRDSSGALVQGAQVTLANTGTTATRTVGTDASGNYAFKNIDVGTYALTLTAPGFEKESLPQIVLTARETRRMDATLKPGAETQTVIVIDDPEPVITTDVSSLAETKIGDELVELPVAIYSRSTGSTSPISTLTTEALSLIHICSERTSPSLSGVQSGSTSVPSIPCAFAVALIERSSFARTSETGSLQT